MVYNWNCWLTARLCHVATNFLTSWCWFLHKKSCLLTLRLHWRIQRRQPPRGQVIVLHRPWIYFCGWLCSATPWPPSFSVMGHPGVLTRPRSRTPPPGHPLQQETPCLPLPSSSNSLKEICQKICSLASTWKSSSGKVGHKTAGRKTWRNLLLHCSQRPLSVYLSPFLFVTRMAERAVGWPATSAEVGSNKVKNTSLHYLNLFFRYLYFLRRLFTFTSCICTQISIHSDSYWVKKFAEF